MSPAVEEARTKMDLLAERTADKIVEGLLAALRSSPDLRAGIRAVLSMSEPTPGGSG